jgi:hypothetical protein
MDDENTITVTGASGSSDTFVIDLNSTYGATTTYPTSGFIAQETSTIDSGFSYTIDLNDTISLNNITITGGGYQTSGSGSSTQPQWWVATPGTHIEIEEIEKMCSEYPALAKVYKNFKTMYDLVKQDWEGKKNAKDNS